jgi:hypothetical protein
MILDHLVGRILRARDDELAQRAPGQGCGALQQ